jgi:hypothetical protein
MNNVVFLTSYQTVIAMLMNIIAVDLAVPLFDCPLENIVGCSFATNPMWRGVEHMCNDNTLLQSLLSNGIQHAIAVNKRVLLGGTAGDVDIISGDELIDSITTPKTVRKGSDIIGILYNHVMCFQYKDGGCDLPLSERLPALSSAGYAGLSALFDLYISHATSFDFFFSSLK